MFTSTDENSYTREEHININVELTKSKRFKYTHIIVKKHPTKFRIRNRLQSGGVKRIEKNPKIKNSVTIYNQDCCNENINSDQPFSV